MKTSIFNDFLDTDFYLQNGQCVRFKVPAVPVAMPRNRSVIVGNGQHMHAGSAPPPKTHAIHAFKASVRLSAQAAWAGAPITGPVCLSSVFVFPRPGRLIWKTRDMPRLPHLIKPDRDNLDKAVLDALKGTVLGDDSIVFDGRIQKWIAAGNEQPHVEIEIKW